MRTSPRIAIGGGARAARLAAWTLAAAFFAAAPSAIAAQETASASEAAASEAAAQDGDFAEAFGEDHAAPALAAGGSAEYRARAYLGGDAIDAMGDADDAADLLESAPSLRVDLSFAAASSELEAKLRFDERTISGAPADVLEEACLRSFLGDFVLEAGKMKVVWGKGDKLHVLDLFNANDYRDFLFPDYIDRRLGEGMVRAAWNAPAGARLEAIWTPVMTPDRVPMEGPWAPAAAKALRAAGEAYVGNLALEASLAAYAATYAKATGGHPELWNAAAAAAADAAALSAAQSVASRYSEASALLPDPKTLDYGQYGLRLTGSLGGVDLGASYYLGRFKTPSVYLSYGTNSLGQTAVTGFEASYDRLQSFGLEAGTALGPLNLRGEAAYYLTDDIAGDDPKVRNNSLNWLAGFDMDLPLSSLNLNVQTIGSRILKSGDIDAGDVEYDEGGTYTNDKLVVRLSDSFAHEKIIPELALLWGIERDDLLLMPKCAVTLKDDCRLELSGAVFLGSEDGEFGAFADKHFAQARFTYSF